MRIFLSVPPQTRITAGCKDLSMAKQNDGGENNLATEGDWRLQERVDKFLAGKGLEFPSIHLIMRRIINTSIPGGLMPCFMNALTGVVAYG